MQVIYMTINKWNKENNINPYLYVGSQENYTNNYFGSSKKLKDDIKSIGIDYFEKIIILKIDENISNIELRQIESDIQKSLKCAENGIFYNRTNSSHRGYVETDEEKKIRMLKCHDGYRKWWDNLTDLEKENRKGLSRGNLIDINYKRKGKTYEEIFGDKKSEQLKNDYYRGENNPNTKFKDSQKEKAIELFLTGNYSKQESAKLAGITYGVIKPLVRKYGRRKDRKGIYYIYER